MPRPLAYGHDVPDPFRECGHVEAPARAVLCWGARPGGKRPSSRGSHQSSSTVLSSCAWSTACRIARKGLGKKLATSVTRLSAQAPDRNVQRRGKVVRYGFRALDDQEGKTESIEAEEGGNERQHALLRKRPGRREDPSSFSTARCGRPGPTSAAASPPRSTRAARIMNASTRLWKDVRGVVFCCARVPPAHTPAPCRFSGRKRLGRLAPTAATGPGLCRRAQPWVLAWVNGSRGVQRAVCRHEASAPAVHARPMPPQMVTLGCG